MILNLWPSLEEPAAVGRDKSLFQVGVDIGMNIHHESRLVERGHEVFQLFAQCVGEKQRGLHHAFAVARGARFGGYDVESRTHALAGDLHQPEFA